MKNIRGLTALVLTFAIVAAACGGSDDTETQQPDPTVTTTTTAATTTTVGEPDPPAVNDDANSATIGAQGGSISSPDGLLTLDIPAGALTEDTLITVAPAPDFETPDLGDGEQLGAAYELGPDGQTFAAPITVSFDLGASADSEVSIVVPVSTSPDGGTEGLAAPSISNEGGTLRVTGQTTHFSFVFAVVLGVVVAMDPADPSILVGDTWVSGLGIASSVGSAVALTAVDAKAANPAVAAAQGTAQSGDIWEATFDCVSAGQTNFTAVANLELTSVVLQFLAQLLPGYTASATVTLDGKAECLEVDTTAVSGIDCAPATFGDPGAGGEVPVTINNECLDPLFFTFNDSNPSDPFWHIHTQQDDIFLSLELYTMFGASWSGQTGTFPLDCNVPWGLCAIFDADGVGPIPVVMWASGDITISALAAGGYDVSFSGVMPAAASGTVYDLQPVTWVG